jgi:hypothetical protein
VRIDRRFYKRPTAENRIAIIQKREGIHIEYEVIEDTLPQHWLTFVN